MNNILSYCGLVAARISASDAASGWAGWVLAPPECGVSVNPIPTRGADNAHRISACPPEFEILAASLSASDKDLLVLKPNTLFSKFMKIIS